MTEYLPAILVALGIPAGLAVIIGCDALYSRFTSQPSRMERNATVWARAVVYEIRQALRDLIREEVLQAMDERERREKL